MIANAGIARYAIRSNVESSFHPNVLSGIKWLSTVAATLLAGAWMGGPALAQQPQPAAAAQQAPVAVQKALAAGGQTAAAGEAQPAVNTPAKTAPRGMNQGIQVSGYWKIDVLNPDGSLVKHVEFENSVTPDGLSEALPIALFGEIVAPQPAGSQYNVDSVFATGADFPFIGVNSGRATNSLNAGLPLFPFPNAVTLCNLNNVCLITKPNSAAYYDCSYWNDQQGLAGAGCFNGLSVQYGQGSADATVLSGSFTAATAGTISSVWSYITLCLPTLPNGGIPCPVPPGTPAPDANNPIPESALALDLTSYTLPTPIPVNAGQSVNVSVSLTFSSVASTSSNAVPASSTAPQAARPPSEPRRP